MKINLPERVEPPEILDDWLHVRVQKSLKEEFIRAIGGNGKVGQVVRDLMKQIIDQTEIKENREN